MGVVVVGGASVDDQQYGLIKAQFECMAKYLSWDLRFVESFSATAKGDLAGNELSVEKMKALGAQV